MLSRFVARIPNHSKIRSFTIHAAFVPKSYNFLSLFVSIGSAFGTQLHTLSLAGQIELYHGLLHSNPSFPQLKELRLWFHDSFREVPHLPVNGGHIATFVNRLSPHLELLGIRSHMVNLSGLFSQLSLFPSLVHLDVSMPFDALEDDFSFHRFLLNTSHTLKKLSIRRNPSNTAFHAYRKKWLSDCWAEPKCFAKLQSLAVHPGFLGHDVDVQCDFIRHLTMSLEEFSFERELLEGHDASLVIGALSQCAKLTVLNLGVYRLTIDMLDQLAVVLPNLRKLGLRVDVLDARDGPGFFFGALRDRSYASWRLEDLSIWQLRWGRYKANHDFMMAFPRSIPSLCSFFGNGHMDSSSG
ncbi:hypothetical protein GALMADRAFT_462847 [Galerina marginata CBS 339.88]|uniref:F-box domain-containing protein n=1 Tax=Galerina marginata (strain CBS 339.88) TaxID=685588 RepID=A0A067T8A6_GALM3|nr:hypothetical protein GALMADRAFT_462847 [Galerina marginata CBS 339.88]